MTKYLTEAEEEGLILAHSWRGFVIWPERHSNSMVGGVRIRDSSSYTLGEKKQADGEEGCATKPQTHHP